MEVTTIISAQLVAIEALSADEGDGAAQAAWKYVLIASSGLSLALLGTVFAYYAGSQVLGEHYNLAIGPLIQAGAHLPHTPVRLPFLLTLLGMAPRSAWSRCTPGYRTRTPRPRRPGPTERYRVRRCGYT